MTATASLSCRDDSERRKSTRLSALNGLDYLEVSDAQTELTVYFLGKAPPELVKENVAVVGGRRIQGLRVLRIRIDTAEEEDRDDRLVVELDRAGDFSLYELCVVALDRAGRPTSLPLAGFDPRYARLPFSFRTACPSELDCRPDDTCSPPEPPPQDINYLAKDYGSFRQLILDRLSLNMPDWSERHASDIGITLVEVLAYLADILSYEQDAVATEAYLETARRRVSVRRHLRLIDHLLHEGCNARAWLALSVSEEQLVLANRSFYFVSSAPAVGAPMLTEGELSDSEASGYQVFEPLLPGDVVALRRDHNQILFHTWHESECCIPAGATSATLRDPGGFEAPPPDDEPEREPPESGRGRASRRRKTEKKPATPRPRHALRLDVGSTLIFEEVRGPKTGSAADADPSHRHVVRLTRAEQVIDPLPATASGDPGSEDGGQGLPGIPVWNIEWSAEDALPFSLCLSAIDQDCRRITDISVARGNVLLVDHGSRVDEEDLGYPSLPSAPNVCEDPCDGARPSPPRAKFRPWLVASELTFREELPKESTGRPSSARRLSHQDPRRAAPLIELTSVRSAPEGSPAVTRHWRPRADLLESSASERHFVVEVDDARRTQLRFGRGAGGLVPAPNEAFHASYRVGSGLAGNVGSEAIRHIVFRNALPSGARIVARNPLPASGGTAPEAVSTAKLEAPQRFRSHRERAIVADDYAHVVKRDFVDRVQNAAAVLRATGHGPEILIAIDPLGSAVASTELLRDVERHLQRFRRIGHELRIVTARQVPLLIELSVCVRAKFLRGEVERALRDALGSRSYGLGKRGLFHPDELSFGAGVYASRIIAVAQAVRGVESVRLLGLERLFEGADGELAVGVLQLAPLEVARLDSDPNFPENGRLSLHLEGGR